MATKSKIRLPCVQTSASFLLHIASIYLTIVGTCWIKMLNCDWQRRKGAEFFGRGDETEKGEF